MVIISYLSKKKKERKERKKERKKEKEEAFLPLFSVLGGSRTGPTQEDTNRMLEVERGNLCECCSLAMTCLPSSH